MIDEIRITYHGAVPGCPHLRESQLNALKRRAWLPVGAYWHEHYVMKHFTHEGGREYRYAPRAGETGNERKSFWRSYTGWKQKHLGHTNPLVLSGELRDMAKIYRLEATATSTESKLRVILPMAQKANLRNPKSRFQINMREELTTVSEQEAEVLVGIFDRELQNQLNEVQDTSTHIIRFFHG